MNKLIIEPALLSDCADVAALYQEGGWWDSSWDMRMIGEIISHSFRFLVVRNEGSLLGMGRIITDGVSDAYLQDIFVTEPARGNRIGTMLVQNLLKICKEAGIGWIGITAAPDTEYFYRQFGFARMGGYIPMRYEGCFTSYQNQGSHADNSL